MSAFRTYRLLVEWQVRRMREFLPLAIVVQSLLALGIVIGYPLLFPKLDPTTVLFLATGAPTVTLILMGLVLVPQAVAQAKTQGTFDYMRTLPVPRLVNLFADVTVWLAVILPGVVFAVVVAALRFGLALSISPLVVPGMLLVALTATAVGYALASLLPPMLAGLVTQVLVVFVLMFSPLNFPADRLARVARGAAPRAPDPGDGRGRARHAGRQRLPAAGRLVPAARRVVRGVVRHRPRGAEPPGVGGEGPVRHRGAPWHRAAFTVDNPLDGSCAPPHPAATSAPGRRAQSAQRGRSTRPAPEEGAHHPGAGRVRAGGTGSAGHRGRCSRAHREFALPRAALVPTRPMSFPDCVLSCPSIGADARKEHVRAISSCPRCHDRGPGGRHPRRGAGKPGGCGQPDDHPQLLRVATVQTLRRTSALCDDCAPDALFDGNNVGLGVTR